MVAGISAQPMALHPLVPMKFINGHVRASEMAALVIHTRHDISRTNQAKNLHEWNHLDLVFPSSLHPWLLVSRSGVFARNILSILGVQVTPKVLQSQRFN